MVSRDRREPLFRSHPLSSERIQALRERVEKSAYRDAKDSDADMLRFKMMQAKLYGYLEGAGRVYARYPDSDKSQPARYARAFAAYRIPDMQRAAAETKELIGLDGKNPYYQELMGQILFESGHWADALPYDRKAVALSPDSVLLQTNLGRALAASSKKEDLDEAVKVLTRATALEPDNPYAWSEMATAYGALKQDGLAQLASAEKNFALGNYPMALNFAQRAKKGLPEGSTSWRRASDIALAAEPEVQARRGRS